MGKEDERVLDWLDHQEVQVEEEEDEDGRVKRSIEVSKIH